MRRAPAVCSTHGCPADATRDGKCATHRRKWDNTRRRERLTVNGWEEQRRAKRIIQRDNTRCHACGLLGTDQADHLIPLCDGGTDDETNMAAIHATPCHETKTASERARATRRGGVAPPTQSR